MNPPAGGAGGSGGPPKPPPDDNPWLDIPGISDEEWARGYPSAPPTAAATPPTAGGSGGPPKPPAPPPPSGSPADEPDDTRGASPEELEYAKTLRGENAAQRRRDASEAREKAKEERERLREERKAKREEDKAAREQAQAEKASRREQSEQAKEFDRNRATYAKEKAREEQQAKRDQMDKSRTVSGAAQQMSSGKPSDLISGGMQIAGTGLLGPKAAALAAGPVGAAIVAGPIIKDAVEKLIKVPFEKARQAIDGFSNAAKDVANNDAFSLFQKYEEGVASTLESAVPILGTVVAEQIRTVSALTGAFKNAADAFIARGKQLQAYDGRLANANAQADVRSLMRDIREAEQTGPNLSRLTDASSRVENNLAEALLPIKELIVSVLAAIADPLADATDFFVQVKPMLPSLKGTLQSITPIFALMDLLTSVFSHLEAPAKHAEYIAQKAIALLKILTGVDLNAKKEEELNDIMAKLLDVGMNLGDLGGPQNLPPRREEKIGFPLLRDG